MASLVGQGRHGGGERVGDGVGLVVAVGQRDQHQVAGGAFNQRRDRAHAFAEDQVAFPVAGHCAVVGFGWPFGDVQRVRAATATVGQPDSLGPAQDPPGAQILRQLLAKRTT